MTIPPPPDWLDAGTDLLKEKIGDHAADLLEAGLAAIELMEAGLAGHPWGVDPDSRAIAIIARARGETPDQTVARLDQRLGPCYDYEGVAIAPHTSIPWSDNNAATPLADIRAMQDRGRRASVGTGPENIYINGHQVPIVPGSLRVNSFTVNHHEFPLPDLESVPDSFWDAWEETRSQSPPDPIAPTGSGLASLMRPRLAAVAAPRESRRRRTP